MNLYSKLEQICEKPVSIENVNLKLGFKFTDLPYWHLYVKHTEDGKLKSLFT